MISETAPLSESALIRLERGEERARERYYGLTVRSGPDKDRSWQVSGTTTVGTGPDVAVRLSDPTVSRCHLELEPRGDGLHVRDLGSRNGTFLDGVRIESVVLHTRGILSVAGTILEVLRQERELAPEDGDGTASFGEARAQSAAMRRLFQMLARVAPTDLSVLLHGETGTGKELLARGIHGGSARRDRPFVVVDCGAIAPDLIESELFGHVKGAFTGALSNRAGAFIEAKGGTVFLDEVGELPLPLQPRLLRALEARTVKQVGSDGPTDIDVRVIAATHRDLDADVGAGKFRRDLYFRLAVAVAYVPSLAERPEDIPLLVRHFLGEMGRGQVELPEGLFKQLSGYPWPGNVRELRNVVQRAIAGLDLGLAPGTRDGGGKVEASADWNDLKNLPFKEAKEQLVDQFIRDYVSSLLDRHDGNIAAAARAAGLSWNHLHDLVSRYAIRPGK